MSKKKKITRALVSAGITLGIIAGGTAAVVLETRKSASAAGTSLTPRQQESRPAPAGSINGKLQPAGEQTAAFETYIQLSEEIRQKYDEQYAALFRAFESEVEEIYASVLGGRYTELKAEYDGLCGQYQGLVNGFYGSEEYVSLKSELDVLVSRLTALDRGSEEYRAVMEEINAVWGKISILAGEVNSQISLLSMRAAEITAEIKAMAEQNKEVLNMLLEPLITQFNADRKTIQSSLMRELQLLRQTLGI